MKDNKYINPDRIPYSLLITALIHMAIFIGGAYLVTSVAHDKFLIKVLVIVVAVALILIIYAIQNKIHNFAVNNKLNKTTEFEERKLNDKDMKGAFNRQARGLFKLYIVIMIIAIIVVLLNIIQLLL